MTAFAPTTISDGTDIPRLGALTLNWLLPEAPRLEALTVTLPAAVEPFVLTVVAYCPEPLVVPLAAENDTFPYPVENDTARPDSATPLDAVTVATAVVPSPLVIDDGVIDTDTDTPRSVHVVVPLAPPLEAVSVAPPVAVDVVEETVVVNWPDAFVVPLAAAKDTPDREVESDTARPASTAPLESFTVAVTVEESPRTDDGGETATPTDTVRTASDALTLERSLTAVTVTVPAACDAAIVRVDRKVPSDWVTPVAGEKETPVDDDSVTA